VIPSVLRILALLGVLTCLFYLPAKVDPLPAIQAKLSSAKEVELSFFPSAKAQYDVFLSYDADAVPKIVNERFLNSKTSTHTNWPARLNISTNHVLSVSQEPLQLRPAMQIGHRLFFQVGECHLGRGDQVEISLSSTVPAPFPDAAPALFVKPVGAFYNENRFLGGLVRQLAKFTSIIIILILLIDHALKWARQKRSA
jgi:hypothetical protein